MSTHESSLTNTIDDNISTPLDKEESIRIDQENTQNADTKPIINDISSDATSKTKLPEISQNDVDCFSLKFGCLPSNYYKYTDKLGATAFYVVRWDFTKDCQRKKEFRPYSFDLKKQQWVSKGFPAPRPLYNLLKLIEKADCPVLIVEGEKTVHAAEQLFPDYVVITSCFGAKAANKTDWSTLEGRDIIISSDCDEAGKSYSTKVETLCMAAGVKSIKQLCTEKLGGFIVENGVIVERQGEVPQGYDLAYALAEGWTSTVINQAMNDDRIAPIFSEEKTEKTTTNDKTFDGEEPVEHSEYRLATKGVFCKVEIPQGKDEPPKIIWPRLCGYLKSTCQIRDKDSSNWGLLFELIDRDGKKKDIVIHREQLSNDKAALELLLNQGLEIPTIKKFYGSLTHDLINDYINLFNPTARAIGVDQVGWHKNCYIMPYVDNLKNAYTVSDNDQSSNVQEEYVLQSNAANPRRLTKKGTLQSWQENVGKYAVNNSLITLSIAAALAAPLLKPLDEEGCCFHFSGSSSTGKTTNLHVASSVWGMGKPSSFRTTDNAAESLCKNSNDGLLLMDELAEIDANSLEKLTYLFGNGTGKGRAKKSGDAQLITTFRVLSLSSGEIGLSAKLAEKGKNATAGQSVRFIEINADAGKGFGVFDTLHGFESGGALSEHLKKASNEHHGVVIDEFLKYITADLDKVVQAVSLAASEWLKYYVRQDVDGQIKRVAKKFALIAAIGEVATDAEILPFEALAVSKACGVLFNRWLEQRGSNDSHEFHGIIERLERLTQEGVNSRFLNADGTDENKNVKEVAGYKKIESRKVDNPDTNTKEDSPVIVEFWILPDVFKREILQNRNETVFYKQLIADGYIIPDVNGKKTAQVKKAPTGRKRFVVVSADRVNQGADK